MRGARDRARTQDTGAAAHQSGDARAVVRSLQRRPAHKRADPLTGERPDGGDLESLGVAQRRQDARKPAREHGLARARRTAHEHVMAARRRSDERVDGVTLTDHLCELGGAALIRRGGRGGDRIEVTFVDLCAVTPGDVTERDGSDHLDPLDQRGLRFVRVGHDHPTLALSNGGHHRGQHAGHGTQASVEPQLADVHRLREGRGIHRAFRGERGDRDRDVEGRSVLGEARGRQVDRETAARKCEAAVGARVVHPLHRFAERLVGQADDAELGLLIRQVRLDLDELAVEPGEGDRPRARGRHRRSSRCSSAPVAGSAPMIAIASRRSRRPCTSSG